MILSPAGIIDLARANPETFDPMTTEESYDFCAQIALGHYENFPVGSVMIPRRLRKHFYAVYAYSRIADDLSDETSELLASREKVAKLSDFRELLNLPIENAHPVFGALLDTLSRFNIPKLPLEKLVTAFIRDAEFVQAETIEDTEDYCSYSADPVGELVLRLFGDYNDVTAPLSDAVCTGLQLANFWQDFSRDLPNGRCYIPKSILDKFDLEISDLLIPKKTVILNVLVGELCTLTREYFDKGSELIRHLSSRRLKIEIKAVIAGGRKIVDKIDALRSDVLRTRPSIGKKEMFEILLKSLI